MIDYHDYIGYKVKIVGKDKKSIEGEIVGYEVGIMQDEDFDSIDVKQESGCCISIPIPEIKHFEVLQ